MKISSMRCMQVLTNNNETILATGYPHTDLVSIRDEPKVGLNPAKVGPHPPTISSCYILYIFGADCGQEHYPKLAP